MATVDVATYQTPYKHIPATVSGWDDGREATWPASTATLLSCGGSAVLVDALMTLAEGERLADWIEATGLELTTVYVTHAHADHFFGATSCCGGSPRRGWSAARRSPPARHGRRRRPVLDESRRYVQDFGDAVESSGGPGELIATMLARYGALGNPYTLWVAAYSQFAS
jgi:glyoxylase-like metal-dependent hydrolase (beta-lactamase superfamily II)